MISLIQAHFACLLCAAATAEGALRTPLPLQLTNLSNKNYYKVVKYVLLISQLRNWRTKE